MDMKFEKTGIYFLRYSHRRGVFCLNSRSGGFPLLRACGSSSLNFRLRHPPVLKLLCQKYSMMCFSSECGHSAFQ